MACGAGGASSGTVARARCRGGRHATRGQRLGAFAGASLPACASAGCAERFCTPLCSRSEGQGTTAGGGGEVEGRDLGVALAPAGDGVLLPGREHVAGLLPGGRFARDHVHAVDRHGVARAGASGDPVFLLMPVHRERLAAVAVELLDVGEPSHGMGGRRREGVSCGLRGRWIEPGETNDPPRWGWSGVGFYVTACVSSCCRSPARCSRARGSVRSSSPGTPACGAA